MPRRKQEEPEPTDEAADAFARLQHAQDASEDPHPLQDIVDQAERLLRDLEAGQQDGLAHPGRSHVDSTPPKAKRGRKPKAPLGQATIYDFRIEDPDVEAALEDAAANAAAAKKYRDSQAQIRELLKQRFPEVVVGYLDEDEGDAEDDGALAKGPFAICGGFRFMAAAPVRPKTTTSPIPGQVVHGWRFEAARLINNGAVKG